MTFVEKLQLFVQKKQEIVDGLYHHFFKYHDVDEDNFFCLNVHPTNISTNLYGRYRTEEDSEGYISSYSIEIDDGNLYQIFWAENDPERYGMNISDVWDDDGAVDVNTHYFKSTVDSAEFFQYSTVNNIGALDYDTLVNAIELIREIHSSVRDKLKISFYTYEGRLYHVRNNVVKFFCTWRNEFINTPAVSVLDLETKGVKY